ALIALDLNTNRLLPAMEDHVNPSIAAVGRDHCAVPKIAEHASHRFLEESWVQVESLLVPCSKVGTDVLNGGSYVAQVEFAQARGCSVSGLELNAVNHVVYVLPTLCLPPSANGTDEEALLERAPRLDARDVLARRMQKLEITAAKSTAIPGPDVLWLPR